jgi:rSAM/selenodomain-associated transferase 2
VVIVALNEAAVLPALLADLALGPAPARELLVVDGGSRDGTPQVARLGGARVIASPAGRGLQLARGVAASGAPWLLLLHADGRLPSDWGSVVAEAMAAGEGRPWAFRLAIDGPGLGLRLVEALVALRSRWRSLPYGDQGLLISRSALASAGGISPIPLMEDLELVLRLRRRQAIGVLPASLRVSGRRWRRLGVIGTTLANARLRRAWRRGVDAATLAARY